MVLGGCQSLSKEDKARLLQFVTGTSKVPLEGFSALQGISCSQKFQIHKAYGSNDRLPSAHTWYYPATTIICYLCFTFCSLWFFLFKVPKFILLHIDICMF